MSRFDSEINWMTNEIRAIKTQYQRNMGQLRVIEYTVPITFQLYKNPDNDRIISTKSVTIFCNAQTNKKGVVSAYIDLDDNNSRIYTMLSNNHYSTLVDEQYFISTISIMLSNNQSDIDTIAGGGTPEFSVNAIISSTIPLDIEVTYHDN